MVRHHAAGGSLFVAASFPLIMSVVVCVGVILLIVWGARDNHNRPGEDLRTFNNIVDAWDLTKRGLTAEPVYNATVTVQFPNSTSDVGALPVQTRDDLSWVRGDMDSYHPFFLATNFSLADVHYTDPANATAGDASTTLAAAVSGLFAVSQPSTAHEPLLVRTDAADQGLGVDAARCAAVGGQVVTITGSSGAAEACRVAYVMTRLCMLVDRLAINRVAPCFPTVEPSVASCAVCGTGEPAGNQTCDGTFYDRCRQMAALPSTSGYSLYDVTSNVANRSLSVQIELRLRSDPYPTAFRISDGRLAGFNDHIGPNYSLVIAGSVLIGVGCGLMAIFVCLLALLGGFVWYSAS